MCQVIQLTSVPAPTHPQCKRRCGEKPLEMSFPSDAQDNLTSRVEAPEDSSNTLMNSAEGLSKPTCVSLFLSLAFVALQGAWGCPICDRVVLFCPSTLRSVRQRGISQRSSRGFHSLFPFHHTTRDFGVCFLPVPASFYGAGGTFITSLREF